MKLLFSEYKSDYHNYIFPYVICAIPEAGDTPAAIFAQGFLPSSRDMQRYYMCRQVRVRLANFKLSSENRRIIRKGANIEYRYIAKADFKYTQTWQQFCKTYADIKFGQNIMTYERLDSLFQTDMITHFLIFTDQETQQDIGIVTLYVEDTKLAYFYYSFYDLDYHNKNLGMFIMTTAVELFSKSGQEFLYLGSCYSKNALYKTQFSGMEFFNGSHWSTNLKELKFLIARDQGTVTQHLIENEEYQRLFCM
ncbi:hypothetical protein TI05_00710 [Achromatium sp. WMS3]|nr:hypothetical protein TI05_00710 [Achromatium sp. WMS3]